MGRGWNQGTVVRGQRRGATQTGGVPAPILQEKKAGLYFFKVGAASQRQVVLYDQTYGRHIIEKELFCSGLGMHLVVYAAQTHHVEYQCAPLGSP